MIKTLRALNNLATVKLANKISRNSILFAMAPKASIPRVPKLADKVKMGSTLNVESFLKLYNNSDEAKKVIKAFTDCVLLRFISFDYQSV